MSLELIFLAKYDYSALRLSGSIEFLKEMHESY